MYAHDISLKHMHTDTQTHTRTFITQIYVHTYTHATHKRETETHTHAPQHVTFPFESSAHVCSDPVHIPAMVAVILCECVSV